MSSQEEALNFLMRVHYKHFMTNSRFWYEPHLQAADMYICKAASDLRKEIGFCANCKHSLADNRHGIDQNDIVMDDKGDLVYGGTCTYCVVCYPGLKEFLTRKK